MQFFLKKGFFFKTYPWTEALNLLWGGCARQRPDMPPPSCEQRDGWHLVFFSRVPAGAAGAAQGDSYADTEPNVRGLFL